MRALSSIDRKRIESTCATHRAEQCPLVSQKCGKGFRFQYHATKQAECLPCGDNQYQVDTAVELELWLVCVLKLVREECRLEVCG